MTHLHRLYFNAGAATPTPGSGGATPPSPTPPAPSNPPAPAKVSVGGREYSPSELEELVQQSQAARTVEQSALSMLNPDLPESERITHMRVLLTRQYGKERAERMIQHYTEAGGTEDPPQPRGKSKQTTGEDPEDDPVEAELTSLRQEVETLRQGQFSQRRMTLEKQLSESIDHELKSSDFGKLYERISKEEGQAKADAFLDKVRKSVYDDSKSWMNSQYEKLGVFDDNWVRKSAALATKQLLDVYRPVIGANPALGKAPETDAGEAEFLASKPVDPPAPFGDGGDPGKAQEQLRAFSQDRLRRAFAEGRGKTTSV